MLQNDWKKYLCNWQVNKDEGIRPTTLEGLAKLKPAFKETGSSTAGMSVSERPAVGS